MAQGPLLIVDSSATVGPQLLDRFEIRVVPILVQVGPDEFRDGVDLDPAVLYRALEIGTPVKSAAPSPVDYLDAIESAGDRSIVVITPATEFTRMHANATLAAELSGRPVAVVDSRSAAAGHGLVVQAAAERCERGGAVEDVVAAAERAAARTDLVASIESLELLRASGRVPAMALGLANHLGVQPVFRMRQGSAERLALPRSTAAALSRIAQEWRVGGGETATHSAVFHAGRPERADQLARTLGVSAAVTEFSAAMSIHTGPGVVGVAWLRAEIGVQRDFGRRPLR